MKRRVLVVDDHEEWVGLVVHELMAAGYDVIGTTSPTDALVLATLTKPEVVLTDLDMPTLDGYEVARRVRADPATSTIKLVAVSGSFFDPQRAPTGGWDAFVGKPVAAGELPKLLERLLGS